MRTELGNLIKRVKKDQYSTNTTTRTKKVGIIKEIKGSAENEAEYIVRLKMQDGSITGWISINNDPGFLSQNYGSPQDLVNTTWCEVEYEGPSIERGYANIIGERARSSEKTSKWNELGIQGTAFAPPGSGLI
jgi:hypothetical protein